MGINRSDALITSIISSWLGAVDPAPSSQRKAKGRGLSIFQFRCIGLVSPPCLSKPKRKHMKHCFKIALAKEFGIEEAILIDEFQFQISRNKANNKNFFDGRFWTYNTQKAYADIFPYLNAGKVKRIINSLIEKGVLMKGNYNTNQYDRTNWYAFTDFGLSIVQKCYIEELKMTNGRVETVRPIPSTIPSTIPSISFTPSDEGSDGGLFDDADASTMTMLSHEENIPYAPRNKNVTSEQRAEWFEDLWQMYERKGSKANAKKEFAKLTEEEIAIMRCHIPAYLQARPERQYRQDFERYIKHKTFESVVYNKQNEMLYDPEANMTATNEDSKDATEGNESVTINGVTYR